MLFAPKENRHEANTNLTFDLDPEADALLEKKMAWAKERQAEAEQLALDAARLLSCTEDQLSKLSKQGFFKRCWNAFTGENASIERANTANLLQMQQMSLRYINMLQEQQIMTANSLLALRNNPLTLSTKQEETQQLIISLAEKTLARFEALENRVDQMEITQNLQGWLLTLEDRDYDEKFPTPHLRMIRVINDYFGYKKDDWNFNDVLFLRKALRTVGLNPKEKLSMEEFIDRLVDEIAETEKGFDVYSELLLAHAPAELENPCQFVLDNISSQVVTTLNGLYTQFYEKQEVVEELSEHLKCSPEEAFKRLLKGSISKMNVDIDRSVSLSDIAAEVLMGLSLEHRLYTCSEDRIVKDPQIQSEEPQASDQLDAEIKDVTSQATAVFDSWEKSMERSMQELRELEEEMLSSQVLRIIIESFDISVIYGNNSLYVKNFDYSTTLRQKINSGIASFAMHTRFDDILVYYDSTLFGGGDEGIILTNKGMFYKESFSDPSYVPYESIYNAFIDSTGIELVLEKKKIHIFCFSDERSPFCTFFNKIVDLYHSNS